MQIQHQPVIEYNAQLTSLRDLISSPKGHCQSMIAYKQVIHIFLFLLPTNLLRTS